MPVTQSVGRLALVFTHKCSDDGLSPVLLTHQVQFIGCGLMRGAARRPVPIGVTNHVTA